MLGLFLPFLRPALPPPFQTPSPRRPTSIKVQHTQNTVPVAQPYHHCNSFPV
ncbi:uncharacterized protein HMPREF1541_03076 [Cyphellophora europaea CBS 101466]|uniref:Uncharacterized protein n=1 Tax=Cyphellophora europaea (strain CBS 101466) TaxID=1220924 RepID=W2RX91_CYPE1|nr:uncharacterized protein HMPREF1541_03076 [Cyphellophora europaea CBS 101466]ETN41141.1 hypothetical protein HMPREF1541_03076 [Cyphellophora europaea CBS 101466]